MSKYTSHIIIALLVGIVLGIVIARWLDAHTEPEPRGPKPGAGRYKRPPMATLAVYTKGRRTA